MSIVKAPYQITTSKAVVGVDWPISKIEPITALTISLPSFYFILPSFQWIVVSFCLGKACQSYYKRSSSDGKSSPSVLCDKSVQTDLSVGPRYRWCKCN